MIHRSKVKLMEGFEVEVCKELPKDEFGDADMDEARYTYREFAKLEDAREYAKKAFPGTPFGCAHIRGFRMEPVSEEYPNILDMEHTDFFEEVS